jgi:hypothetical protein
MAEQHSTAQAPSLLKLSDVSCMGTGPVCGSPILYDDSAYLPGNHAVGTVEATTVLFMAATSTEASAEPYLLALSAEAAGRNYHLWQTYGYLFTYIQQHVCGCAVNWHKVTLQQYECCCNIIVLFLRTCVLSCLELFGVFADRAWNTLGQLP